ncbi:hypothetical protein KSC_026680 [Ktedonobacter sp. SOSP1-52]|uniref:hypothetical protein n=1 Tax=Ktedonobacter sp. SOSP1-52 TaxID=2778366 RepID=UPI0019155517|nr:hypothetical protein [Ktedonobacter sp. SOSP1-52]GHO63776.1 hypothetical protein KSC_026680 [Ktedonobacter sp. SOSP1-52]
MEDLTLMLRSAIPVDDVDILMLSPGNGIAVIWLNLSERPDVKTLLDRHAEEGGYAICTWFYGNLGKHNMLVGLRVEMREPTRSVFHLAFKVKDHQEPLSLIAQAGKLWCVPGPPPAHLVGTMEMTVHDFVQKVVNYSGQGMMIELQPHLIAELQQHLDEWKRIK